MRFHLFALWALTSGCVVEEWRNADYQLDVLGADLHDEDRVRICVGGVGAHEEAVGAGRIGFTGIPTAGPLDVSVQQLGTEGDQAGLVLAQADPAVIGEDLVVQELGWSACELGDGASSCRACDGTGRLAAEADQDWLLAVRFVDD